MKVLFTEVWMDDYSKYYYQRIGSDKGDFGDISDRVKLRKDLQCKTFQWYLDNIFPELVSVCLIFGVHVDFISDSVLASIDSSI